MPARLLPALALLGAPAAAQPPDSTRPRPPAPAWQLIPFAGYGAHSPLRWGATPDRGHRMLGVQFARPFARAGAVTFAYAPNVVPLFVLTNNPAGAWSAPGSGGAPVLCGPSTGGCDVAEEGGATATLGCESTRCAPVFGVAAVPLGIRADLPAGRRVTLYAAAGMGLVRFARTVPVQQARHTNLTFEGGGGVLVRLVADRALQLGYKWHHLSNAYTAARNPGVDGDVFYAGLAWTVGGARRAGRYGKGDGSGVAAGGAGEGVARAVGAEGVAGAPR